MQMEQAVRRHGAPGVPVNVPCTYPGPRATLVGEVSVLGLLPAPAPAPLVTPGTSLLAFLAAEGAVLTDEGLAPARAAAARAAARLCRSLDVRELRVALPDRVALVVRALERD